jgi:predicted Zn-dependent protease
MPVQPGMAMGLTSCSAPLASYLAGFRHGAMPFLRQPRFNRPASQHGAMRLFRCLLAVLLTATLATQPVAAQSILRDAETEAFLNDLALPIGNAAGLRPGALKVVLIGDKEINAFVVGGQVVYIHSGLIMAADNAGEVQGVIAHEVGHIAGGHVISGSSMAKAAGGISILSLLVGVAAMAAGAGEAGMAAMAAGQQAAMGRYLSFSRAQESSADAAGAGFLRKAHLSGKGMLSFFGKLRQEEYRYSSSYQKTDPFQQTHPMSAERQATLTGDITASPYFAVPTDPALEARFLRIKGKLFGFTQDPPVTLAKFPESDQSAQARYARTYAWHRGAYPDRAVTEVDKLVASAPHDPYYLELKGQVLLESGRPKDAIVPLREAVAARPDQPLISALLGHALIASEDPANLAEAKRVLRVAVQRDDENPFAWYQLGVIYAGEGDTARALLASAERYSLSGESRLAMQNAEAALRGIPPGTSDYIRAQDIALASRAEVDALRRRR